ncbi:MAG: Flagellar biosynthetic protein FliP [Phycisphaerae bacterium]|nr:Flagellar biosynthetic protein FliP [Phycisphaerae bacterium]
MFEHGGSPRRSLAMALGLMLLLPAGTLAQSTTAPPVIDNPFNIPDVQQILPAAKDSAGVSSALQIFVILTVLTIVPSILIMMTSFARIMIVLALLRQALGVPQLPPSQIIVGLSMFLTMLVMAPAWGRIKSEALDPYLNNQMLQREAADRAMGHLRDFMYYQIEKTGNQEDIYLFLEYSRKAPIDPNETVRLDDVPSTALIPAFVLSELKTAFILGFQIYLPFLVIDMVISSILISMGMMMLPPVMISLPFKLLLFVLADGWHLVVGNLLESFA